jgi:hypothetical protein
MVLEQAEARQEQRQQILHQQLHHLLLRAI